MDFEFLPVHLAELRKKMQKIINKSLEKYDVTSLHSMYVIILYHHQNGITMKELTEIIKVDKANTTRVICDLENKKYVYKDSSYSKGNIYKLTDKGFELAKYLKNKIKETDMLVFEDFTLEEKKQLNYLLIKLFEGFNKIIKEEK